MQARHVNQRAPSLLLLDVLDLQDHATASSAGRPSSSGDGGIQLLPDPGLGERVFVSLPHAVFSIRLSWLPSLAHALVTGIAWYPLTWLASTLLHCFLHVPPMSAWMLSFLKSFTCCLPSCQASSMLPLAPAGRFLFLCFKPFGCEGTVKVIASSSIPPVFW